MSDIVCPYCHRDMQFHGDVEVMPPLRDYRCPSCKTRCLIPDKPPEPVKLDPIKRLESVIHALTVNGELGPHARGHISEGFAAVIDALSAKS
jgi:tRNA(Ile2) C34 agmatinyltransferase TiaS